MATKSIDPAYLIQLQFQMLAAGVPVGYLVSWSRTGLTVHRVPFNAEFIKCSGNVLKYVIENFIDVEEMPAIPTKVPQIKLIPGLKDTWAAMIAPLNVMLRSCENVKLDNGAFSFSIHASWLLFHTA